MQTKPIDYENPETFCGKCKHAQRSTMCTKYKKYLTGCSKGFIKLDECKEDIENNRGMF